ncbi:MAG: EAL domain-containing protein [Acidimicrobiales bacterium]|nr:EAL domain-containing protein [Acidimicrobiales bacterium]RZV47039.1 MAG: EAL domain-containing protein [Acidimicrobiales bacterium]
MNSTNLRWIAPITVAVITSLALVLMSDPPLIPIGLAAFMLAAIATSGPLRNAMDDSSSDSRPFGGGAVAASHTIALLGFLLPRGMNLALLLLIAAVGSVLGIVSLVKNRLGSRPTITEREMGIFAAGIGLVFFVLAVEPDLVTAGDYARGIAGAIAFCLAIFTVVFLLWLAGHDPATVSLPLILLGLAQLILALTTAVVTIGADLDLAGRMMLLLAAGMALAALYHPDLEGSFTPAVITNSEVDVRRSLISFLVVLVGPILVGVDLGTPIAGISLPVLTVGSGLLSLFVAIHLQQLVRHWVAVEHQGQHDPLTSLPNRPLFFQRLDLAIESSRMRDAKFATMFLDLDRFKAVNDTLGHDAGDELLRQVADRLLEASRRVADDLTVARLGGDEFALLVPHIKDDRHAHAIGRLFLDQFLEPFDVGLRDIYVTPSIGLAQFPKDGDSVEELIENADTAMFEAKERGRNMVVTYSPEQRVPGAHRLEIEAALHRAIEKKELQLYYQPQVDVTTGQIFAVEALLRWLHPTLGQIGPDKFVPVAEESSLIDSIGQWTLEEACRTAARWGRLGLPEINVAVNLSPRQFQKSIVLADNVAKALRDSGLQPQRLELELTESLALEKPEEVNNTLRQFREMGIRTAIDDFGVGHTGLDYLDRISVDTLKIDRSFINRIGESGAPLVTAVISLARGLNLDVIAEGVETKAQVDFLRSHGCRFMQGYLFSKPLTAAQLERVLRNQQERVAPTQAAANGHPH